MNDDYNIETDCVYCYQSAVTPKGIIYVRVINPKTDKYDNMPACEYCWKKEHRT
jgi:hypothetical protein